MMRLWKESYTKTTPVSSAVFSLVAHALLIGAAIGATKRSAELASEWIENRAYYLPPPNRTPAQSESRETLQYIALAPEGLGSGAGGVDVGGDHRPTGALSPSVGDLGRDLTSSAEAAPLPGMDSVFSELEVDSTVTRYPGSAAPAYPVSMLKQSIQGSVITQYVVDTTGFADTASLHVLRSTHEDFTAAVRAALPYMRFTPAKVGARHVRQLVEQEFSFKIDQTAAQPTGEARKPDSAKPESLPQRPRG